VKWVAKQLGGENENVTVNDVFCACVTAALARQLDYHRKRLSALAEDGTTEELPRHSHMHIALPVHLKGGVVLPGESVGNNLGAFVVRLPGEGDSTESSLSPHQRLLAVHNELATIKKTPIAILSHILAKGLSYSSRVLPSSCIAWLFARSNAGSIAVVSNNRGLPRHVHLGGRRIESMHGFVPLPPGIPVGVVVMSYAGDVSLTVTAEPWAVPDADQFLVWVLDEYLCLLQTAKQQQLESTSFR
jgi:diacylglycerol O-acyltransferase